MSADRITQINSAHKRGGISAFELPHTAYVVTEIVPGLELQSSRDGAAQIIIVGGVSEDGEDLRQIWLIAKDSKPLSRPLRVFPGSLL